MREMKDSGIEWVGKVPKHWKCCKQKYGLTLLNGRAFKESEFLEDGKYKVLRVGNLFTNPIWHYSNLMLEDNKYCQKGDLLYSWSMSYAPFIWSGDKVIYHYHIWKVLIDDILCKKFVYYYLLALTEALYAEIHETTMGFITMGIMNNSYLPYCNLEEQQQIANFLDTQCSEIDATAEDIQKEIALLEDYKKSVITEAVTKGLNPDAEMKDSGIEWIGEIPKHWKVLRIKNVGEYRNGLTYKPTDLTDENTGTLVLRSSNIQDGKISLKDNVYVSTFVRSDLKVKKGDILICSRNGSRELVGKNAIIEDLKDVTFGAFMMIFRCDSPKYLYYILNSKVFSYYLGSFFTSTNNQLTGSNFGNMKIVYVSDKLEQSKIVSYLDDKCSEIDTLIADKKRQLDILADYKKSLIYEYVTGKKEVPVNE